MGFIFLFTFSLIMIIFVKRNIMRTFNNIWNAINPNSDVNLDRKIEFYKKYVVYYKRFTPVKRIERI